ncbi:hypothetical protein A9P82_04900 [Arachidicoccus ginsenosidimutans]|nr:hypothetical protein A9P82_04900 [Arachidicoccus sp. BS20]
MIKGLNANIMPVHAIEMIRQFPLILQNMREWVHYESIEILMEQFKEIRSRIENEPDETFFISFYSNEKYESLANLN